MASIWKKLRPDIVPAVVTDGYKVYKKEVLGRFSEQYRPPHTGRGRKPHIKSRPMKGLRYGIVLKTRNGRKTESVSYESAIGVVPRRC
jgi:hypothetical protein